MRCEEQLQYFLLKQTFMTCLSDRKCPLLSDLRLANGTVHINISWCTNRTALAYSELNAGATKGRFLLVHTIHLFSVISLMVKQFLSQCWNGNCSEFVTMGQICRLWRRTSLKKVTVEEILDIRRHLTEGSTYEKATKNKLSRLTSETFLILQLTNWRK